MFVMTAQTQDAGLATIIRGFSAGTFLRTYMRIEASKPDGRRKVMTNYERIIKVMDAGCTILQSRIRRCVLVATKVPVY